MIRSRLCFGLTIAIFIFLYVPILLLMINSFNASKYGTVWAGFSLKWYYTLFSEPDLWKALVNSMIIAVSSAATSLVLGSLAAFTIYRYRTPLQKVHYGLIYAPLLLPDILMGISLLMLFVAWNVKLGLFTIYIAHTTFCISYVTMLMLSKLQNFDYSLVEAAHDLGAGAFETFKKVIFPLITPGLVAAVLLSFTLSIDDFVITFFVAGEGSTTLPLYIYSMIKYGSTPIINALSTLILLGTFLLVFVYHTFAGEEQI